MSSEDERNRPENSVAGLSNLQMSALNDSITNLMNTGLEQIHQRLDEIQTSQDVPTVPMMKAKRRILRMMSDPSIDQEGVIETESKVISIHLLELIVLA